MQKKIKKVRYTLPEVCELARVALSRWLEEKGETIIAPAGLVRKILPDSSKKIIYRAIGELEKEGSLQLVANRGQKGHEYRIVREKLGAEEERIPQPPIDVSLVSEAIESLQVILEKARQKREFWAREEKKLQDALEVLCSPR